MTDLVLGIDTGGTYTDGVLLEYESREVVATTKTPTTHHDLQTCILGALDELLPADPTRISLVAISTTLATNAIAEGKGRPVGLLLLGYDPDLVDRFNFEERFATRRLAYIDGGHDLHGGEQAPLDRESLLQAAEGWHGKIQALAISGYFSPFNPSHEELAADLVRERFGLPVVLGHQLASQLNSVERATTATLNAALIPILREFIGAMMAALVKRGIGAPLMVVRGEGSLTRAETVALRPVETVHSGPAASAIGGSFLAGRDRGLVVDIGGTTTDLAIVDGRRVRVNDGGTQVGPYRTAVRAADVRSIGLGGDSVIGLDPEDRLTVGPERVQPISQLAYQQPRVAADLKGRVGTWSSRPSPDAIEYWFLAREPAGVSSDGRAREALSLLGERPWSLPSLLERLGLIHPIQFGGGRLIKAGIIARAALTPTDLLHLTGEFDPWNVEAARIAADFVARLMRIDAGELTERVKQLMAERVVAEIVSHLSGHAVERSPSRLAARELGTWLFEESLYGRNPYLSNEIRLEVPLIGIGAPAGIFLPRVADMLDTELILPPHYEVANAVGAVAGGVVVTKEAWIFPQMRGMNVAGYYAQLGEGRQRFTTLSAALAATEQAIGEQAADEARAAGAVEPVLEFERLPDGAESYRLRVRAMGSPALQRRAERRALG